MAASSPFPTLQHFYGADLAASSLTSKEQAWLRVATVLWNLGSTVWASSVLSLESCLCLTYRGNAAVN